jgi:hypothetical protein
MKGLPLLMTSMSGKVGGIVASHNKGGGYFRQRSVPVNPQSSAQQLVRGFLSSLAPRWSNTLTDTQRAEWDNYAANVLVTDRIGQEIQLSGVNWYVAGNALRLRAGYSPVDDGPATLALAELTEPSVSNISAGSATMDIAFDDTDTWANEDEGTLLVFMSRPTSPGRSAPVGGFQYAGQIDGDGTTPPTSPVSIPTPFPLSAGQRVFVRMIAVSADGRKSPQFRDDDIVVA